MQARPQRHARMRTDQGPKTKGIQSEIVATLKESKFALDMYLLDPII